MDDFLQVPPGLRIVEHDGANFPPIQPSVGVTDLRAEPANNIDKTWRARSYCVAREHVGVNGRYSEALEACAHVALASGYATRERHARYTSSAHLMSQTRCDYAST
jgi:hypothetical protein